MLTSALSGEPVSISAELVMRAARLREIDRERICFLVSPEEWVALRAELRSIGSYTWGRTEPHDPVKIEICGIEVRRR